MKKYLTGDYEKRPWGSWEVISDESLNPGSIVKRIIINPGMRLSLQYHLHRNENWFITKGNAVATVNDVKYELGFGDSISILRGAVHRVENTGTEDLIIIEIQYGDLLDESDIIRLEDDFNRK